MLFLVVTADAGVGSLRQHILSPDTSLLGGNMADRRNADVTVSQPASTESLSHLANGIVTARAEPSNAELVEPRLSMTQLMGMSDERLRTSEPVTISVLGVIFAVVLILNVINLIVVFRTGIKQARAALTVTKYSAETERVQQKVRRTVDEISSVFDSTLGDINVRFCEELEEVALSLLQHCSDSQIRIVAWSVLQQHVDLTAKREYKAELQKWKADKAAAGAGYNVPAPQKPQARALTVPTLNDDVGAAFELATVVPETHLQRITAPPANGKAPHLLVPFVNAYRAAVLELQAKAKVRNAAAADVEAAKKLAEEKAAEFQKLDSAHAAGGRKGDARPVKTAEEEAGKAAAALKKAQEKALVADQQFAAGRSAGDAATATLRSEVIGLLKDDFAIRSGARSLQSAPNRAAQGAKAEIAREGPYVLDDSRTSVHDIARASINADGPDYVDLYEEADDNNGNGNGNNGNVIANDKADPLLGQSRAQRLSVSALLSGASARADAELRMVKSILEEGRSPDALTKRARSPSEPLNNENGIMSVESKMNVHTAHSERIQNALEYVRIWEDWADMGNDAFQPWVPDTAQDLAYTTSMINAIGRLVATALILLASIIHWSNAKGAPAKERFDGARSLGIAYERLQADTRLTQFSECVCRRRHSRRAFVVAVGRPSQPIQWAVPPNCAALRCCSQAVRFRRQHCCNPISVLPLLCFSFPVPLQTRAA